MTGPKSEADELIDIASNHETLPSAEHMDHLHQGVLRRAALGGAVAGALLTKGATAGAVGLGQLAAYLAVGAVAGGIALSWKAFPTWTEPGVSEVSQAAPRSVGVPPNAPRARPTDERAPSVAESAVPQAAKVIAPSAAQGPVARETAERPAMVRRGTTASPEPNIDNGSAASSPSPAMTGVAPAPTTTRAESLPRQLELLRRMRLDLAENRGLSVISLYRANEALFGGGALEPEARAAFIAALCQSGHEQEARRENDRFQQAFPNSHLAQHLAKGCAAPGELKP